MKNIPLISGKNVACNKFKMFNLNKEGGWSKFKELTEDNDVLKKTIENEETNPTKLMNVIEKELNKVKFKSFGKVTVRNELKTTKEIKKLQNKKIEVLKGVETANEKDQKIKGIE